jgi:hypothetical protein
MIAPVDHPMADRKSVLPQEVVDGFLILPKYGKTRTRLNEWLEPVEDDVRISMELDSSEMMKRFVIAGMGVSFVAASNCQEEIAAGKLKAVSLAPEPLMRRLGLIYRKDKALSKAALGFIQVVSQYLSSEEPKRKRKKGNCQRSWRDDLSSLPDSLSGFPREVSQMRGGQSQCPRHLPDLNRSNLYRRQRTRFPQRDEVPASLRTQLLKSTNGANSATILIADRRGRREIARAMRNLPGSAQRRLLRAVAGDEEGGLLAWLTPARRKAILAVLILLTMTAVALVFTRFG